MSGEACVFFDRDGVVNVSPGAGYVERWEDFHLMPGFPDVLRTVRARGYRAVVVTNQRGVALGLMTRETVEGIHARLRELLAGTYGLELLDVLYCPHDRGQCACRKPQPGMLLEAARRHGLDLARSWMVGDGERDVEAGANAGCRTIRVASVGSVTRADYSVPDMSALNALLERVLVPQR